MPATKSRCPSSQATSSTKRHQPLISIFKFCAQRNYFKQRRNVSKLRKTATFLFLDPDLLPFLLKRLNIFKIAPWPAEKEFLKQVKFIFLKQWKLFESIGSLPTCHQRQGHPRKFRDKFWDCRPSRWFLFRRLCSIGIFGICFWLSFLQ